MINIIQNKQWYPYYWVVDESHARREDEQVGEEVMDAVGLGLDYNTTYW
jgi:hypothetical protein